MGDSWKNEKESNGEVENVEATNQQDVIKESTFVGVNEITMLIPMQTICNAHKRGVGFVKKYHESHWPKEERKACMKMHTHTHTQYL